MITIAKVALFAFLTCFADRLVNDLNHDRCFVRERASRILQVYATYSYLEQKLTDPDLSAEQISRLRRILHNYNSFAELPCLDSLPQDFPDRNIIINRYASMAFNNMNNYLYGVGYKRDGWLPYREATRLWLIDCLCNGHPRTKLLTLLDIMIANERQAPDVSH